MSERHTCFSPKASSTVSLRGKTRHQQVVQNLGILRESSLLAGVCSEERFLPRSDLVQGGSSVVLHAVEVGALEWMLWIRWDHAQPADDREAEVFRSFG